MGSLCLKPGIADRASRHLRELRELSRAFPPGQSPEVYGLEATSGGEDREIGCEEAITVQGGLRIKAISSALEAPRKLYHRRDLSAGP